MEAQLEPVTQKTRGDLSTQVDTIMRVADLLEKGVRNTGQLVKELGVSRMTAIKYRNEALKLLHNENKHLNTEAMRAMEVGRLNYWIDWLQGEVSKLGEDKDDREYKNKLLGRLDNFQGRLHSITGLNTTVNVNYEEKKRITFVMSDQPQAAPIEAATPTEGTVIDTPSDLPSNPV